ncbi:MAG TPA: glycosyltransferase [Pirellulales bacterium]|jgi:mannosyltransferase OCH1-like enzyme|nr:glycosyltransferase [Pirellulales bacterium]
MTIPKIIHQTWKDENVPAVLRPYVESWRRHHPQWEWRLWTDKENRRFIRRHYPAFLKQYDRYPWPIQRVDAVRYFLLERFGGLYVDLDFQCLRQFDPLLEGRSCVLGQESLEHGRLFQRTRIVCNALMAAEPGHPFFRRVIEELPAFAAKPDPAQTVLTTTGPFMLSDVYDGFASKETIALMPPDYFYPLSMEQADEFRNTGRPVDQLDAYAVHFHVGSWWRPDEAKNGGRPVGAGRPNRWQRRGQRIDAELAIIAGWLRASWGWGAKSPALRGAPARFSALPSIAIPTGAAEE